MLPEQAIRNYYTCRRRMEVCEWGEAMHYMALIPKDTPKAYAPHTLTGDEWRRAWAEAHDAQTDAALDAIY